MGNSSLGPVLNTINSEIINPILALLFAAGLLVFIWGLAEMLMGGNQLFKYSDEGLKKGKDHMLWGLAGMFVMLASWAIIRIIAGVVCNGSISSCA